MEYDHLLFSESIVSKVSDIKIITGHKKTVLLLCSIVKQMKVKEVGDTENLTLNTCLKENIYI